MGIRDRDECDKEAFTEYVYSLEEITRACRHAGLRVEQVADGEDFGPLRPDRDVYKRQALGFGVKLKEDPEKAKQNLLRLVEPHDLVRFGLIPELVGRIPVSYTHLDVYKRQTEHAVYAPARRCGGGGRLHQLRRPVAVSYTHLDVYQRQVRVGSLYDRTLVGGDEKEDKTGMTPAQQLDAIMPKVAALQQHLSLIHI